MADHGPGDHHPWQRASRHLEIRGGRTLSGVLVGVFQRLLAMTVAVWHNDKINVPIKPIANRL